MKVPSNTKYGEFVNFRAILLTRCQNEFENPMVTKKKLMKDVANETEVSKY